MFFLNDDIFPVENVKDYFSSSKKNVLTFCMELVLTFFLDTVPLFLDAFLTVFEKCSLEG